jgi:cytochrome c oxidase assembly protein subunit 15
MGCPDWPRCFGRWIPPTNVDQIPSHIDPTSFNIVLAWIEYGNRSLGVIVGFSIIILNVIAIYYFRKELKLLVSAILSLILVGVNGGLGALVVSSVLDPFLVSLHMILALILVSVLSYACIESYKGMHLEKFKDMEININANIICKLTRKGSNTEETTRAPNPPFTPTKIKDKIADTSNFSSFLK